MTTKIASEEQPISETTLLHSQTALEFSSINWLYDHHKAKEPERSKMV